MANISELLATKYRLLGETADSERDLRASQSALLRSQAATNPEEAAGRTAAGFGQGAAGQGAGAYQTALAAVEPSLAGSENNLRSGQANEANAAARVSIGNLDFLNNPANASRLGVLQQRGAQAFPGQGNFGVGSGFDGGGQQNDPNLPRYAEGTAEVGETGMEHVQNYSDGKTRINAPGDGTVDTQKAMLANGEAVLNRGAADHLGRDVIDVLNAIGNIKMGQGGGDPGSGPATKVSNGGAAGMPGYAQGTDRIQQPPGQGGTWIGGDAVGGSGNTSLRKGLGMGVPRPTDVPKPITPGYAAGTSDVGRAMEATHADAARNAGAGGGEKGKPKAKPEVGVKANQKNDQTMGWGTGDKSIAPGYAKGTSKTGGKGKPPGGKSKVTPEMLQQIMAMSKGGGGMMPPGQAQPMPMPMPQPAGPPQPGGV